MFIEINGSFINLNQVISISPFYEQLSVTIKFVNGTTGFKQFETLEDLEKFIDKIEGKEKSQTLNG